MNTPSTLKRSIAGLLCAAGVFAIAAPTASAQPAKIDTARTKCLAAIDRRVTALNTAAAKISGDKHLTEAHKSALSELVATTTAGMNTQKAAVTAATDAATLRPACEAIATDYRVFAVVIPKIHLVRAVDGLDMARTRMTNVSSKLDAGLTKAEAAGKDTAAARASASAFTDAIGAIDTSGLADKILAVTPADYNANKAVLDSLRSTVRTEVSDAKTARDLGKKAVTDAKALRN